MLLDFLQLCFKSNERKEGKREGNVQGKSLNCLREFEQFVYTEKFL